MEIYFQKDPVACRECVLRVVNKPLSMVSHAGSMRGFHFGTRVRTATGWRGEIVIHVQCSWRLVNGERVLTGLGDWGQPYESQQDLGEWNPSKHGNLQQRILEEWLGAGPGMMGPIVSVRADLVVSSATLDPYGSAEFVLTSGNKLQIFPDCSREENWRIFYPEGTHFVI